MRGGCERGRIFPRRSRPSSGRRPKGLHSQSHREDRGPVIPRGTRASVSVVVDPITSVRHLARLVFSTRFRLGSGRTKLAGARWTICTLCETRSPRRDSHWSPFAPIAACGPPKSPILPELRRTHLGLPDARAEFEPGIFVLLQCGVLRRLALPGMQSREHDPKRLQGPRCEMQQKRQRHFAFVLDRWLPCFYPQVCQNLALRERQSFCFVLSISAPRLRRFLTRPICAAEQSSSKVALRSLG